MNRNLSALAVLAVSLGSTGCLVKDTTHRVYLSPSGSVAWMVLEESVRSDENDAAKRSNEEREWLDAIAADRHPVAEGLRRLAPDEISTRLLRSARPYMALTDARFARVDQVIRRLFEELGLRGEATLQTDAQGTTLSVFVDLASLDETGPEPESPAAALLEDFARYRFVLTDGTFVAAVGFDIIDDGAAATLQKIPEGTIKAGGVLTLALAWRAGGNAGIPLVR
jgi:hypothetical protein